MFLSSVIIYLISEWHSFHDQKVERHQNITGKNKEDSDNSLKITI